MKKLSKFLLILCLLFSFNLQVFAANQISVYIDNKPIAFDTEPQIINGTTMVPLRGIFETLGYRLDWDEDTGTITGSDGLNRINLKIGSLDAYTNGNHIPLTVAPMLSDNLTLVPLRFVAESSGASVHWDEDTRAVQIFTYEYGKGQTGINEFSEELVESLKDSVVTIYGDTLQGSGVILTEDGYIATNFHVIEGTSSIVIRFNDGKQYTGPVTVAGYDSTRDIAVIKMPGSNLPYAQLPAKDTVAKDQAVMAIGTPNGIPSTVSYGTILEYNDYVLSNTAPIDHGSSGGALFNSDGEIIGITTAYTNIGISYAIPIQFVAELDISHTIRLSDWKSVTVKNVFPEFIDFRKTGKTVTLHWSSVYGVEGYKVYISYHPEMDFEPLVDNNGDDIWQWGFPSCLSIENMNYTDVYVKISSVIDGVESPLSPPQKLIIE